MAAPQCVDYIGSMWPRIVALSLFITTCGVQHPGAPEAQLAWDDGAEAGWTVTQAGYLELPAHHLTKSVGADQKLVTVVDATGATFIAQLIRGQKSATLVPADEHLSASGRWTHLTMDRQRLPASAGAQALPRAPSED